MKRRLTEKEATYWSTVFASCGQVFLGVFAATLFIGELYITKVVVIVLNLLLSITFWVLGWRLT